MPVTLQASFYLRKTYFHVSVSSLFMFWQIYPRQANCQEKLGFGVIELGKLKCGYGQRTRQIQKNGLGKGPQRTVESNGV